MSKPEVIEVSPTIWCVRRRSYLTCSYIIATGDKTVLVDAGMDSGGLDMQYALSKIGRPMNSVKAILLTHWHNDHAAGAAAIQELTKAPVYYHDEETGYFTGVHAHGGLRGWLSDVIPEWGLFVLFKGLLGESTPRTVVADVHVKDGDVVLDDFEVITTPGHTPGHVAYRYRPERALFAGDSLAVVGGKIHFMARLVTPDVENARLSMVKCLSREIDLLCPGHRGPLNSGVRAQCEQMVTDISNGMAWPLLG